VTRPHPVDVVAGIGYVSGGGLAGAFAFGALVWPGHGAQIVGAGVTLVAFAGFVRAVFNPTPRDVATDPMTAVPTQPAPGSGETKGPSDDHRLGDRDPLGSAHASFFTPFALAIRPVLSVVFTAALAEISANKPAIIADAKAKETVIIDEVAAALLANFKPTGMLGLVRPAIVAAVKSAEPQIIAALGGEDEALYALVEHYLTVKAATLG